VYKLWEDAEGTPVLDSRMTFTVMYYHVAQEIESYVLTLLEQHLEKQNLENYTEVLSFFFRSRVFPKLIDLNRYGVEQRLCFEKWDRVWLEGQVLRTEDADVKKRILDFTDEFYDVCLSF
jgi:hypothetical protein